MPPAGSPESSSLTAARIMDAAESLFAEHGFDGSSMRMLTAAAGVNLAAVNYHFGSKAELIRRIFQRRLADLNGERMTRLEALEASVEPGVALPPEQILEAFFAPAVRLASDQAGGGAIFMRLLGQAYTAPVEGLGEFIAAAYEQVLQRYLEASCRALPGLPSDEVAWRLHFVAGAATYVISGADALALLKHPEERDPARLLRRMEVFFLGGLQAPWPAD
ncbi:TetR/AcrR family transcriptional regulator [Uliginosibacterium sp. 31-12]|uniref:TetR/AcrR family transcriptional regulator n=1 Tax=Uliginosibacterium sp. 31-12 TaxID=3062781 RepID=UPI0026E37A42|nr:TetR/AcrR family transcriptional regulator [Uliginosibacterium sp. 31-12]